MPIIDDAESITKLLQATKRIAVLGMKTEEASGQPAFYVPKHAADAGYEIIPVPVYYPDAKEILGRPVYRKLADVPGTIDLVDVFRRPTDLAGHLDDIIAAKPKAVWLQSGIRNDEFAEKLSAAGITVVQDRCLMVELRTRR